MRSVFCVYVQDCGCLRAVTCTSCTAACYKESRLKLHLPSSLESEEELVLVMFLSDEDGPTRLLFAHSVTCFEMGRGEAKFQLSVRKMQKGVDSS